MRVALRLGWAALRHRPGSWALLAVGLMIAAVLPVMAAGLRTESTAAAVRAAVADVPGPQRAVLAVTAVDLRADVLRDADATVRDGFRAAGLVEPNRLLVFRPLASGAAQFSLGAAGDLPPVTHLDTGRLPASCTPQRCEVLAAGVDTASVAPGSALARGAAQLGVVITGTASIIDPQLVGSGLVAGGQPLLLGADPTALADLESLALFGRNTAWLSTLDAGAVTRGDPAAFAATLAGVAAQANVTAGLLTISWPAEAVTTAATRAAVAAARFPALGAGAAVLQLGFAVVTAAGLRRRAQAAGRLLVRRGASAAQLAGGIGWPALLSVSVGLCLGGLAAAALLAARAGGPTQLLAWSVGWAALGAALPTLAAIGLAAVGLTVTLCLWPASAAAATALVLDAMVVVGLAAMAYLLRVGSPGTTTVLVVGLALLAGLVASRLWRPCAGLLLRLRPGPPSPAWSLGLRGGRRRPLLPAATAGFLAATCAALVFAGGYRDSLQQSALDQAAARVPLDVLVTSSADVTTPLPAVLAANLDQVTPDLALHPMVASPVTVFAGTPAATSLPLVGVDLPALPKLREITATTGATNAATLADQLHTEPGSAPLVVPAGSGRLQLRITGLSEDVRVRVWLRTATGLATSADLQRTDGVLVAPLLDGPERQLTGLELAETATFATHRQHGVGEGRTDRARAGGTIRLGSFTLDGVDLIDGWTGWGSDQAEVLTSGPTATARFAIGDSRVVLLPAYAPRTRVPELLVAVDPVTAAGTRDGVLGVTLNGSTVRARVVATLSRFPGAGEHFVLADRAAVTALLDRSAPGTAAVAQVWLSAPAADLPQVRRALEASPAAAATVVFRSDLERTLGADPVAIRSIALLQIAGVVAVGLGLIAVAAAVRADRQASATDLAALELDGASRRSLAVVLLLRSASAIVVGVGVGVLGGVLSTHAAVRLLVTGPGGTAVVPPLRVVLATPTTAVTVFGVLISCLLVTALAAHRSLAAAHAPTADLELR